MTLIILLAIAFLTVAALWLQLDALVLVVAPLVGLFFLLAIAPAFVEALEAELAEDDNLPAASAPGPEPVPAEPLPVAGANVRWGVLHLQEHGDPPPWSSLQSP